MDRDRVFWSVVSALALGTLMLTTYSCWSPAQEPSVSDVDGVASPARASSERNATVAPRSRAAASARSTDAAPPRPVTATGEGARHDRAAVRARLSEYVRTLRERTGERTGDPSGGARSSTSDGGGMPAVEMNWEQYRAWVKVADALAKRDYRATERLLGDQQDALGSDLSGAMMDALVDDYRQYLDEVVETQCQKQEPQSVWRKTIYMALLLAKHERLSPPLEQAAKEAQLACGF